jgi:hypothetical protein
MTRNAEETAMMSDCSVLSFSVTVARQIYAAGFISDLPQPAFTRATVCIASGVLLRYEALDAQMPHRK